MEKQIINRKNLQSFCRTCLTKIEKSSVNKEQKYNVGFNEELPNLIFFMTSEEVNKDDDYPKFLCQLCFQKFENFKQFRFLCQQSKRTLDNILNSIDLELDDFSGNFAQIEECYDDIVKPKNYDVNKIINEGIKDVENTNCLKSEKDEEKNLLLKTTGSRDEVNILKVETGSANGSSCKDSESSEEFVDTFEYKDCADIILEENTYIKKSKNDTDLSQTKEPSTFSDNETKCKTPAKKTLKKRTKKHKNEQSLDRSANATERRIMIRCKLCTRRCLSQENLDAHMRTHQGLKEFACKLCDRAYDKACRLKVHIDTKHRTQIEEFTCSFEGCDKKFSRTDSYRAHMRRKHIENQAPRMTYVCEDCGRIFQNVTQLREHRYKHFPKELYPYHCEQCGKRYTSRRTYKEHLLRHAGIKKFECKFCGMKKTTIKELNVHLNYHTKEKQWPCQLCNSVFNSSANLGLHVRIVHKGIRRFACGYCDQTFGKADTLKHHEMRHTGEKPHECQICGKRFIQAVALRTHLKTHSKSDGKLAAKQQKLQSETFLQPPQSAANPNEASTVCLI